MILVSLQYNIGITKFHPLTKGVGVKRISTILQKGYGEREVGEIFVGGRDLMEKGWQIFGREGSGILEMKIINFT